MMQVEVSEFLPLEREWVLGLYNFQHEDEDLQKNPIIASFVCFSFIIIFRLVFQDTIHAPFKRMIFK